MSANESVRVAGELGSGLVRASGLLREVPDFPEPGVLFRDIGPVLADPEAFRAVCDALGRVADFDLVVGVEARGFLLGAAVAYARGTGVVGFRKPGKTPVVADSVEYSLEYGSASLDLPADTIESGQRVLVVDDVLATGGTLAAARQLVDKAGAEPVGAAVVLELSGLGGREALPDWNVQALFTV